MKNFKTILLSLTLAISGQSYAQQTQTDTNGIEDAAVTKAKLSASVNASLDKADTALQSFTEADGSTTNELQSLGLNANTLSLTLDAVTVDLSPYLDNSNLNQTDIVNLGFALGAHTVNDGYEPDTVLDKAGAEALGISYGSLSNLPLIPSAISDLTDDSGHLTSEVDGSITNELQTLSLSTNTLSLSNGGSVDLSIYIDDTQPTQADIEALGFFIGPHSSGGSEATTVSDTSEIDLTLTSLDITADIMIGSINENKLNTSINTSLDLADTSLQAEVDGSITNELQTLSLSTNDLTLSNAGGTVDLSVYLDNTDTIYDDTAIQAEVDINTTKLTANTFNVTAAGALMDSEISNLVDLKAFDFADFATAVQGTLANSATQPGDNISTLNNDEGYFNSSTQISHSGTTGYSASEHIDWTGSSAGTIHETNYVDNDTQKSEDEIEDIVNGLIVGGANITATYDDGAGTLTLDASGGGGGGGNLTTKGDLEVYTTSQTRLPVGADDFFFVADSSAASGLAWKEVGPVKPVMAMLGINSTAQSVNATSRTELDFLENTGEYFVDSGITHSTSTNPERIYVDVDSRCVVSGGIGVRGTTGNYRYQGETSIAINGGSARDAYGEGYIRATSGATQSSSLVLDSFDITGGEYFTVGIARINTTSGNATTDPDKTKLKVTCWPDALQTYAKAQDDRSISIINPAATDDSTLLYTTKAITVTGIASHITGSNNVVFNVQHSSTRTGTAIDVFTSDITLTSESGDTALPAASDPTIPANSWMWVKIVSVSGSPTFFHTTVIYETD